MTHSIIPTDFKLKYLSDSQLKNLERNPGYRAKGSSCPVCSDKDGNQTGRFAYEGVEYECPDDDYGHVALQLAKLYWLHNIPLEYQKLVWDEWLPLTGNQEAKDACDNYVENFHELSLNGCGITFTSKGLGTGKTWAATATLKRLVKQGVDGWYAPFYEVAGYYEISDPEERAYKISRVEDAELLVLDEVRQPMSKAQETFLSEKLENLIRPRTNANLPTIFTTNLTIPEIEKIFPRTFSLMSGKNLEIELTGADVRLGNSIFLRNFGGSGRLPIT